MITCSHCHREPKPIRIVESSSLAEPRWHCRHCGTINVIADPAAKLRRDEQRRIDDLDRASGVQDYEEPE